MTTNHSPQTVLITGANSGVGEAAAVQIAKQGWRVIAAARSPQRGEAAVERIKRASRNVDVSLLDLDLASFDSVRRAAEQALAEYERIDVLINNAGLILSERTLTGDGLESTMQINHYGHFLLTSLLLPTLLQSDDARVVNVSSQLYLRAGAMPIEDLQMERRWRPGTAYAVSKLANILFTRELHRRYADSGLASFAVHPGSVRTGFSRDGDTSGAIKYFISLARLFFLTPEKGAQPVSALALNAARRSDSGEYFGRDKRRDVNQHASSDLAARQLWEASNQSTGAEWLS